MSQTAAVKFPWEELKAETLRAMCKDLLIPLSIGRKREDMVNALASIEELGLSSFHAQHETPAEVEKEKKPSVKAVTKKSAATPKRPAARNAKQPASTRKPTRRTSGRSTFDGVVLRSSGPISSRRRSTKSSSSRA